LAQKLSPTVVHIKVTKMSQGQGWQGSQGLEGPFGELFKQFFKDMPERPALKQQGTGSGVIMSADGYILTNNHVVAGANAVTVTLADEQEYAASVIGGDPKTDLAVVKIAAKHTLPVATLGDSETLKVGDWVLAIGNPFGLDHTVTAGIVSAKGRVIGAGPYDDFIQTDASINPGNSGGPLINMQGDIVGINTAIVPYGQGIGFAIPINTAKPLIPQLVAKGAVTRGYLGVNLQTLTPELAKVLKVQDRKGALVSAVMAGSPAEKAGVQRRDVIVAFNNQKVENARDLAALVATTPVSKRVTVTVLRDGSLQTLPVTVSTVQSAEGQEVPAAHTAPGKWGMQLQEVTPEMARQRGLNTAHGVIVVDVQSGSPAAEAGIREGDMLLEVNRQLVHTVAEVQQALTHTDVQAPLLLLVEREQGRVFVALGAVSAS
jgi:serine protease Do